MSDERRIEPGERKLPNAHLNDYVSYYVTKFLESSGITNTLQTNGSVTLHDQSTRIERGSLNHLVGLDILQKRGETYLLNPVKKIPDSNQFLDSRNSVLEMANLQIEVVEGRAKSVRSQVVGTDLPKELIAYSGHCLMETSYDEFLNELQDAHLGNRINKPTRTQPKNAWGAGVMMEPASRRIAASLADFVIEKNINNAAVLGLGSGNGSTELAILEEFAKRKISLPQVLPTDIDVNTRKAASDLFNKYEYGKSFDWMQVDMGDADYLRKAARKFEGKQVFIHIGYILHESNKLAEKTLYALGKVFPKAVFLFSEYYLQEKITPEIPLHFQTIHELSGQELKSYVDNLKRAERFGYRKIGEVVHNPLNQTEPLNSTILFSLN